jgi:hypothetical protein
MKSSTIPFFWSYSTFLPVWYAYRVSRGFPAKFLPSRKPGGIFSTITESALIQLGILGIEAQEFA